MAENEITKDKQIEEMAKLICNRCLMDSYCAVANSGIICDDAYQEAEALKNAGYRLASDVAREIFEDVEKHLENLCRTGYVGNMSGILAELKKKYTEGNNG